MRYCHACDAQLPESLERCVHCGGRLADEPRGRAPEVPRERDPLEGLLLLARRAPRQAARLLRALDEARVAFVPVADGGTDRVDWLHGSFGHEAVVEVYVRAEDAERAARIDRALLKQSLPDLPDSGEVPSEDPGGSCPACGFGVAPEVRVCPDCGLSFPD